jgi:hypothetical protein
MTLPDSVPRIFSSRMAKVDHISVTSAEVKGFMAILTSSLLTPNHRGC